MTTTDKSLTITHFAAMKSPMVLSITRNELLARVSIHAASNLRAFNSCPHASAAP
jgi:hypothetical protein